MFVDLGPFLGTFALNDRLANFTKEIHALRIVRSDHVLDSPQLIKELEEVHVRRGFHLINERLQVPTES